MFLDTFESQSIARTDDRFLERHKEMHGKMIPLFDRFQMMIFKDDTLFRAGINECIFGPAQENVAAVDWKAPEIRKDKRSRFITISSITLRSAAPHLLSF